MGSLEGGLPLKRDHHLLRLSSVRNGDGFLGQKIRSRFGRVGLFKKINYLQFICGAAVFFFFVFLFQIFLLPASVIEDGIISKKTHINSDVLLEDFSLLSKLDFGEDIDFESLKIVEKFRKQAGVVNQSNVVRFGYRKPKLALVFANLWVDQHQILMTTVATALLEIGYEIEVFSQGNGPAHAIWKKIGVPVTVNIADKDAKFAVDWLNYDGILVNSLNAVEFLSCLMQEPFRNVPLAWTIHEQTLTTRLRQYVSSGKSELVDMWRKYFDRATVVVFPNYILPVAYSTCDPGNYFVIPGSPEVSCNADNQLISMEDNLSVKMEYGPDDFVVAIVGSQLSHRALWLDNALILKALYPLLTDFGSSNSHLKIIILAGDSRSNYSRTVEIIALKLGYPKEMVKHMAIDETSDTVITAADVMIYGSFLEENSFPDILVRAMCSGKPIIAPDLPTIRKYVSDRVNGYLFPKDDIKVLTRIMFQIVSNGKLSLVAQSAASVGKLTAKNLMVSESVEGYALLLENILTLPSEVAVPRAAKNIPMKLKAEWQWHLFENITNTHSLSKTSQNYIDKIVEQFNHTEGESSAALDTSNITSLYTIWEEQKHIDMAYTRKRREDEELKDRTDQPRGTWDEIYRSARRADRSLHERDEGELERTGQPLCIYEPYIGEGTWPFLHNTSLYRGIGLSRKSRRPGADDIDAPSRLPLLNNVYYRDVLGEYGAFFAIANRIDQVHKNAWIGFQSWRATAQMKTLSKSGERSLLDAIDARRHGDAFYFWARLDSDSRNPLKQDFWSFCDAINAGKCQFVFSETVKQMYGIKQNLSSLPLMPLDGGTWSVMHSWVLPTKSFLELVMFSRLFVDALDAQFYDDHQKTGYCYLSISKDKHCYSRLLELLVNIWAYHSARRMVYVDPETGFTQEQHMLSGRKGQMWIKFFEFTTLKGMDEDMAEELDTEHPMRRCLWPSTGEIFWQGLYEKERRLKNMKKEKKRKQSRDKIERIRKRSHQKVIGKYVKPVVDVAQTV